MKLQPWRVIADVLTCGSALYAVWNGWMLLQQQRWFIGTLLTLGGLYLVGFLLYAVVRGTPNVGRSS